MAMWIENRGWEKWCGRDEDGWGNQNQVIKALLVMQRQELGLPLCPSIQVMFCSFFKKHLFTYLAVLGLSCPVACGVLVS